MIKQIIKSLVVVLLAISLFLACSNQKKTRDIKKETKRTKKEMKKIVKKNSKGKVMNKEILGDWLGSISINKDRKLRITFSFTLEKDVLKVFMGSPDQMAMKIPVSNVDFKDNNLSIEIKNLNIKYSSILKDKNLKGTFAQNGQKFPLELKKVKNLKDVIKKYKQTPKKPYPYIEEEVTFENKDDNVILSGTFTYPKEKKKFTTIVLIAGSGPNDRNETAMGHFLLLSDYLTKKGYATLRFDKRGVKKSTGNYMKSTTLDFAKDVEAAVDYLKKRKEVDINKIGLIGHSEGGLIAPIVASKRKDIAFIVLMAGTGVNGEEILLKQNYDIAKVSGATKKDLEKSRVLNKKIYDLIKTEKDSKVLEEKILKLEPKLKGQTPTLTGKWFKEFLTLDPKTFITKVTIPTLAINGDKDLQVSAKENLEKIEKYLKIANNKNYTIKYFKGLNHLFQTCKIGSVSEYNQLDEIIAPQVLEFIANWINKIEKL